MSSRVKSVVRKVLPPPEPPKKPKLSAERLDKHKAHVDRNISLRSRGLSFLSNLIDDVVEEAAPVASDIFDSVNSALKSLAGTVEDLHDELKSGQKLLDEEEQKLLTLSAAVPDGHVDFQAIEDRRQSLAEPEEQEEEQSEPHDEVEVTPVEDVKAPEAEHEVVISIPIDKFNAARRGNIQMADVVISPRPQQSEIVSPTVIIDELPVVPPKANKPVLPNGQKEVLKKALSQHKKLSTGQQRTMDKLQKMKAAK